MGKRSGGRKTIIPVVGHPSKFTTSAKWASQAQRQGKGQIIDSVFYWFTGDVYRTHRERDSELREIEALAFERRIISCDIAHEHEDDVDIIPGGPQFPIIQLEPGFKKPENSSKKP